MNDRCQHLNNINPDKITIPEHPVMLSAEPGERWAWCYIDEEMLEY